MAMVASEQTLAAVITLQEVKETKDSSEIKHTTISLPGPRAPYVEIPSKSMR